MDTVKSVVSAVEAAAILNISRRTVLAVIERGELPGARKLGNGRTSVWVIPADAIEQYRAKHQTSD